MTSETTVSIDHVLSRFEYETAISLHFIRINIFAIFALLIFSPRRKIFNDGIWDDGYDKSTLFTESNTSQLYVCKSILLVEDCWYFLYNFINIFANINEILMKFSSIIKECYFKLNYQVCGIIKQNKGKLKYLITQQEILMLVKY